MKIKKFNEHLKNDKKILTTYQIVTPESAEVGDYEEQGWYDEEGESMIPDEYDAEEGITAVDKAIEFLKNERYATEPSSNIFHKGISYSTPVPDQNYTTGEDTYYSCYLDGFTEEEEELIYLGITNEKKYNEWKESGLSYKEYKDITKKTSDYNL